MKLSELIEAAQKAMAENGDIEVAVKEYGCGYCNGGTDEDFLTAETEVRKRPITLSQPPDVPDRVSCPTFVVF